MKRNLLLAIVVLAGLAQTATAMTPEERAAYRDKLLQLLPDVPAGRGPGARPAFSEWAKDHLPPDFDALPKINSLPDPLLFIDGKRVVKTQADWQERRAEIYKLFETYYFGRVPPKPKLDQVIPVDPAVAAAEAAARGGGRGGFPGARGRGPASGPATAPGAQAAAGPASAPAARGRGVGGGRGPAPGSVTRIVDLKYGPNSQITTRVTLTIPPGNGPFPVIIFGGPDVTNRGYISCASTANSPDNPPAGVAVAYPDYDFGTMGQIAFATRMVCDYLYTVPEVDKPHIAITGYSRLGKMASICAMYDDRITAVLAGSTGVGGVLPWRMGGEHGAAEGIESMTRSYSIYFAPQLRYFSGRDDKLPVDGNLIVAMIAPRAILSYYGEEDEVGNIYGNEASAASVQKVFDLLGAPADHNAILHYPGHHSSGGNSPRVNQWLDIQFGKSNQKWMNDYLYAWDYNKWLANNKSTADVSKLPAQNNSDVLASFKSIADWEKKTVDVRKSVESMLGTKEGGKGGPDPAQKDRTKDPEGVVDWAIDRSGSFGWLEPEKSNTEYRSFNFGEGTRAELYYPKGTAPDAKLPTVIWLHGYSYPMGYMWVYRSRPDLHPILALVRAGYAVVGFDQTGHGSRQDEFATFFDRFPQWSRLGRMVSDTRAVIDTISKDGMVDANKIYLYGYSMGGIVALHTAALDNRVKGVVSICGFTPMRTDTSDKGAGGLARYSVDNPLIPQMGAFIGNEAKVPYDYNELIATVAPRPVYVVNPQLDRDATPADVHAAVDQARKIYSLYKADDKLMLYEPWDYNRLPEATQDKAIEWMKANMK